MMVWVMITILQLNNSNIVHTSVYKTAEDCLNHKPVLAESVLKNHPSYRVTRQECLGRVIIKNTKTYE